jgi:hypothetical protein
MNFKIEKVVTARGRVFEVDTQPYAFGQGVFADAAVDEIDFTVGDPSVGFDAGYSVKLSDGRRVELSDVVEVWYASEEPVVEGANVND